MISGTTNLALFSLPFREILSFVLTVFLISLLALWAQNVLRGVIWSVLNWLAGWVATGSHLFCSYQEWLGNRVKSALDGLAEEGREDGSSPKWRGWYVLGPLLYGILFAVFAVSDLAISVLIFHALGIVQGSSGALSAGGGPVPLEYAAGILYTALGVFFGVVLFDLYGVTPFAFLWSRFSERGRRIHVVAAIACLALTLAAAVLMGLWSQWQLTATADSPPPEPWNSMFPPAIRALIVALLVSATYFSGRTLSAVLAALRIVVLTALESVAGATWRLLRAILFLLRQSTHFFWAILALFALFGETVWNWLTSFSLLEALHLHPFVARDFPILADDAEIVRTLAQPPSA